MDESRRRQVARSSCCSWKTASFKIAPQAICGSRDTSRSTGTTTYVQLEPDGFCGNPKGPAAMHYFKTHSRYLGYIVYPGSSVGPRVRAQTVALMDSLRVTRR